MLDGGAEFPDQSSDRFATPLPRNVGFALHPGEALALDHVVAKYHDRARHFTDLVMGVGCSRARGIVAIGEPFHHPGQFLERFGDRAADAPATAESDQHHRQVNPDDDITGSRSRRRQLRGGLAGIAARGGDDLVGFRQHALGVVVDERNQRRDVFGAGDPLREGRAIGLDLFGQLFLHRRRAVDGFEQLVEMLDLVEEMPLGAFVAREPILDLVAAHGQERQRQIGAIDVSDPGQIVMDDVLDRVAGGDETGGDALGLTVAQRFLLADQAVEAGFEVAHGDAQRQDRVLVRRGERGLNAVEAGHCHRLAAVEVLDLGVGRMRDEISRRRAHDEETGFEIATGVRHFGIAMHRLEGVTDLGVTGQISDAVGEKADHRNDAEQDDAGADRKSGENVGNEHPDDPSDPILSNRTAPSACGTPGAAGTHGAATRNRRQHTVNWLILCKNRTQNPPWRRP